MQMTENLAGSLRDLRPAWVAILEAAQEERPAELAEIAISLYGQLGEAQAEIYRLRTSLHALSPAILGGYWGR
jgi:hypothetical protein